MGGLVVGWLSLAGLAGLLPSPGGGWLGLRFLAAFAVLIAGITLLHFGAGTGLSWAAWAMAGLAAAGWLRTARRFDAAAFRHVLTHPVVVFPAAAALLVLSLGGLSYEPISWDELSNWLGLAQDAVLSDSFTGPKVAWSQPGYTPGWPAALAYADLVLGRYADVNSALVPFLMHVGLLGVVHDAIRHQAGRAGWADGHGRLAAWAVILLALALEASWKLAPLNLLVEKPQIYTVCALLLVGVAAHDRKLGWEALSLNAGLLLMGGYLIKMAVLSFAGPFGLLWLWVAARRGVLADRAALARGLALLVLPVCGFYALWQPHAPASSCMSNPMAVFTAWSGGEGHAADVFARLAANIRAYLVTFKLPLSLAALAGLAVAAASRRTAAVVAVLALWLVIYMGSLFSYYVHCYVGYDAETLISWERFTRLPLRVVHLMGLVLPALALLGPAGRLLRWRPAVLALGAAVVVLGLWQAGQLRATLVEMGRRATETPDWVATANMVRDEAEAVAALVAGRPALGRDVLMLAQGDSGYARLKGFFHARRRFDLAKDSNFAPVQTNIWAQQVGDAAMAERLSQASLIWPVALDPWMVSLLQPRIDGPAACRDHPLDYFLVPSAGGLACIAKR